MAFTALALAVLSIATASGLHIDPPPTSQCATWKSIRQYQPFGDDRPFPGATAGVYGKKPTGQCAHGDRVPCYAAVPGLDGAFGMVAWQSGAESLGACNVSTLQGTSVIEAETFFVPQLPGAEPGRVDWGELSKLQALVPTDVIRTATTALIRSSIPLGGDCAGLGYTGYAQIGKDATTGVETFVKAYVAVNGVPYPVTTFELARCLEPTPAPTPVPTTPAPPATPIPSFEIVKLRIVSALATTRPVTVTLSQRGAGNYTRVVPRMGYASDWFYTFAADYFWVTVTDAAGDKVASAQLMATKGPQMVLLRGVWPLANNHISLVADSFQPPAPGTGIIRFFNAVADGSLEFNGIGFNNVTGAVAKKLDRNVALGTAGIWWSSVRPMKVAAYNSRDLTVFLTGDVPAAPVSGASTVFVMGFTTTSSADLRVRFVVVDTAH